MGTGVAEAAETGESLTLKKVHFSHGRTTEAPLSEEVLAASVVSNPMDFSLPGHSVHGILQARILEWVASSFSRGSS